MLLASVMLVGMSFSCRLKKRKEFLGETVIFIQSLKLEIEFISIPVFDALDKISKSGMCSNLDYIGSCISRLSEGEDFSVAWNEAVALSALPFKRQEREKLKGLGNLIGTSDTKGQSSVLSLFSENFTFYQKRADETYEKYGKTSITVSAMLGAGIFILLL